MLKKSASLRFRIVQTHQQINPQDQRPVRLGPVHSLRSMLNLGLSLMHPARKGLPGPEGTAIEMDELRARIKPHPTVLQLQRSMTKLAKLDTGNIEVERLPLDM